MTSSHGHAGKEEASPLRELFECAEENAGAIHKRFRILRRGGKMLLALPFASAEASTTLSLYAPQRLLARVFTSVLRLVIRAGLPSPLSVEEIRIAPGDPLCEFLSGLSASWKKSSSGLGVFAGNPNAVGRRFVLMLFENGRSVAVVKAGVGGPAQELVSAEAAFLQSAGCIGIAAPLAVLKSERVHAFAMTPLEGSAPRNATAGDLQKVLLPWIDPSASVRLADIPGWARVRAACGESPEWRSHCEALETRVVHPAIVHGDFAPWNIKVNPKSGAWQVFDWERGEMRGMPCWDWLHFEIQNAVLVLRENGEGVMARVGRLFAAPEFRAYAEKAGISGMEGGLLVAYLFYCIAVVGQTEGLATLRAMLDPQRLSHTS